MCCKSIHYTKKNMSDMIQQSNGGVPPIAVRAMRMKAAIECREGDRVPFVPTTNNFNALKYDVNIYDVMKDYRFLKEPIEKYLAQYSPDLFFIPNFFPIDPMEIVGYTDARWPGPYYNLPANTPYQYIDKEYLGDDDWDEYLKDPSAFLTKKVLAKRYKGLEGLQYLNIPSLCSQSILCFAGLGAPPVQEALSNMLKAGQAVNKYIEQIKELSMFSVQLGFPLFGGAVAMQPFDEFAANIRGLITTCMDIKTDPELLDEAISRWGDVSIPAAIANAKRQHSDYVFIPLHCGVDSFMSIEDYNNHYWPPLKRMINALVAADITPVVVCEGKYYTRLETLTDVPKGKVLYMFEDVDFAKAKSILGGTACIAGGMPTQYLMSGSKERVIEHTKKMLDMCAPGGGYIMSNSLALDDVDMSLMDAWHETLIKYGSYK